MCFLGCNQPSGHSVRSARLDAAITRGGDRRRVIDGADSRRDVAGVSPDKVARSSLTKDWYHIAFVLLHNDAGGPSEAARLTLNRFGSELVGAADTVVGELAANFATADS